MSYSLSWDSHFFEPVVILSVALFGLVAYHTLIYSDRLKGKFIDFFGEERSKVEWIMFWRYAGVLFFAVIPLIVIITLLPHNISSYGIKFINISESALWIIGISLVIITVQSRSARSEANRKLHPRIRVKEWNRTLLLKNSIGWFIYLLSYEFLFRGLLLFGLIPFFGVWPAILINILVYSLVHIPNGYRETIAAIPFGFILCILTIRTETIWIAFFVHLTLALSNDCFALAGDQIFKLRNRKD